MTRAKDISKILTDANISGTLDVSGAFTSQGIDDNSSATAITIDSSKNVGIGTSTNTVFFNSTSTYTSSLALKTNTSNEVAEIAIINGNNNFGSTIDFARTNTSSNDVRYASLGGYPDSNTAGSESGHIRFQTKGASDSNIAERMRIDSSGTLLIGKTSNTSNVAGIELEASGTIVLNRASNTAMFINRTGDFGDFIEFRKDNGTRGRIGTNGDFGLGFGDTGIYFSDSTDSVIPCSPNSSFANRDNAIDLGHPSVRFATVRATNGTIQTSDRNEKQDIEELTDAEKRVAVVAKGLMRKYRWKDAVALKGDKARIHFGIIAQDLQDAFTAEGLDASRYGMFCSDTYWEKEITVDAVVANEEKDIEAKDGYTYIDFKQEATEGYTEKTRLGVRYSQLLAFIISAI